MPDFHFLKNKKEQPKNQLLFLEKNIYKFYLKNYLSKISLIA